MNISRENTGDLTAILSVEIVEADYADKVKKALNDLRKKANIPGFRTGMVPAGLVKKMYGKSVMADEVNKLLSDSLNQYVVDNKLNLLGSPIPSIEKEDTIDFDTQNDFLFHFDIGFSPEISLEISKDIHVPYNKIEVAESMVEDYMMDIRERFGEHTHPENIEANCKISASFVQLDAEGTVLEGGIEQKNANFSMEDILSEEIKNQLMGLKVGDKLIFDPLKAINNTTKVAAMLSVAKVMIENLQADFSVEIKEITFITPAEINEELFKKATQLLN